MPKKGSLRAPSRGFQVPFPGTFGSRPEQGGSRRQWQGASLCIGCVHLITQASALELLQHFPLQVEMAVAYCQVLFIF